MSKERFRKHIEDVYQQIAQAIDKIPVSVWGFDERTETFLKARKHTVVKEKISAGKLKRMNNKLKNNLARKLGAVPNTVGEVYALVASTKVGDKIPRPAPENPNKDKDPEGTADDDHEEDDGEENDNLILDTEGDADVEVEEDDEESDMGDDTVNMEEVMENAEVKEGMIDPYVMAILKRKGVGKRPLPQTASPQNAKKPKLETTDDVKEEDESADEGAQVVSKKMAKKPKKKMTPAQKKERKIKQKENKKKQKEILNKSKPTLPQSNSQPAETSTENGNTETPQLVFSKFDYTVKNEEQKKAEELKKKRNKLAGRDYKGLIQKVTKREEKIKNLMNVDLEKAVHLEDNIKWNTVMNRAEGEKVRDNVQMLDKALKRNQKMKAKKKAQWGERVSKVEADKQKRQERRETNIQKRKDEKIERKIKKAKKKGRKA